MRNNLDLSLWLALSLANKKPCILVDIVKFIESLSFSSQGDPFNPDIKETALIWTLSKTSQSDLVHGFQTQDANSRWLRSYCLLSLIKRVKRSLKWKALVIWHKTLLTFKATYARWFDGYRLPVTRTPTLFCSVKLFTSILFIVYWCLGLLLPKYALSCICWH